MRLSAEAPAKINRELRVGRLRPDGYHEVLSRMVSIDLADRLTAESADALAFSCDDPAVPPGDHNLVVRAARLLASRAGVPARARLRLEKRTPMGGGLGGGSSDAAAALRLANETLPEPLPPARLHELARSLGADVPFFLADGPQLGRGDGSDLDPLDLPQDYFVLLLLPEGAEKQSTAAVYAAFDERGGERGWEERRTALEDALARVRRPRDLAALPPNDLASSPLADELRALGAFRADVSGAGPAVYGLFTHRRDAEAAERALQGRGRVWTTVPAWYG